MSTKIHIGVDATTWRNDRGFGRFTRSLMRALIARDSEFRYTLLLDRPIDAPLPERADVLYASTNQTLNEAAVGDASRSLADLWRLGEVARKAQFDVFFYPAVYSYFPLLAPTPCIVCYHDCTAERFPEFLFPKKINHRLWQAKTLLAKAQTKRAMTVTETSARDLEAILKFPRERIDVVTEGADAVFQKLDPQRVAAARARWRVAPEDHLFLTLGGMNAHKNIITLLRAMPAVIAQKPKIRVLIVGDTSGKGFWDNVPQLQAFVRDTPGLAERITFTGYLSDEDVAELLNGADALLFPSLWEGFGLPAVEAMKCGAPILSSDRGSLPEIVGDAGLMFNPEAPADIAEKVLRFLNDAALRESLKHKALERAELFTWERGAMLAEESFRRCLAM